MKNNKGFTLTEVLLAAMIVGVIGIALAALTTAAVRESGVGRSRLMLRNSISLFLRQLRQDIRESTAITAVGGGNLTLSREVKLSPNSPISYIRYTCNAGGQCTREADGYTEPVLNYIKAGSSSWTSPEFRVITDEGSDNTQAVLRVRLIVGMNSEPPIKEAVEETFMLPHGFAVKSGS